MKILNQNELNQVSGGRFLPLPPPGFWKWKRFAWSR
ncbi:bacteriocin [Neisseria musculi]